MRKVEQKIESCSQQDVELHIEKVGMLFFFSKTQPITHEGCCAQYTQTYTVCINPENGSSMINIIRAGHAGAKEKKKTQ